MFPECKRFYERATLKCDHDREWASSKPTSSNCGEEHSGDKNVDRETERKPTIAVISSEDLSGDESSLSPPMPKKWCAGPDGNC
ncbi:hypothetical protein B9Z55_003923 [Caenorhabditis nigoni]|uniref:Uncharacterized protein n=1 Tax=Caenorhabditis nigoni TaxID=1611254 RepID=A0A2G5VSM6_9PELO|nr:hypothetical protein B9Z55_003923 [Caenorhabditis nigoni]